MSSFLREQVDFAAHNEEVRTVMQAYANGSPIRVPVIIIGSITNYLLNPELNVHGWSFRDFFENPDVHIQAQIEYQKWQRFNVVCDREMGLPEAGWTLTVDFQNSYDSGWVGCPVEYFDGQVPDTHSTLAEDKSRLYDLPEQIPVNNGLMARAIEFYDYMLDACRNLEYEGRPVNPPAQMLGELTDGPLDLAYKLRGADNLLLDMLTDEQYYHDLMTWLTENLIHRMKSLREMRWSKVPDSPDRGVFRSPRFCFADDAIALMSTDHYREFVYPYHKRIFGELSSGSGALIHLCGDATRHFKFLADSFGVVSFDTGFPVDHGWLREQFGPDIEIYGGPTVMTVKDGSRELIESEVRRICASGVMRGGKFIMIAANNLAPRTPVENIVALYQATKTYGGYDRPGN